MKELNKTYVDTSRISIRLTSKDNVVHFIENHHYAKVWTAASLIFGIYYDTKQSHQFFNCNESELIGCVLYGNPVGFRVVKSISEELQTNNVLELKRLWIKDGYGTNIESYVISQTIKYIKAECNHVKVLVSYADPSVGHVGGIYRATNWLFQGNEIGSGDAYMFRYPNTTKWISDRAISEQLGTNSLSKVLKLVPDMEYKRKLRKNRYIYFTCSKSEKKKLLKGLKHPILEYERAQ